MNKEKPNLSSFCGQSLSSLSFSLIGEGYQKKIKTFCSTLSLSWTSSQIGFECSLSDQQDWGDFHCLVNIEELRQNVEDPSWILMAHLFEKWRKSGFLKQNGVSRTILEFDIGSSLIWPPIPNICLLFAPHQVTAVETITDVLSSLKEKKHIISTVNRFLNQGWTIDGIGLMLARTDCLRVLFRTRSSVDLLIRFFKKLGLSNVADVLFDVFGTFPIDPLLFEIDINEDGAISPRVGIDIASKKDGFSEESILQRLYLRKLVNLDKKRALLSWIGEDRQSAVIYKDIHHFKFVCSTQQNLSVKAYLSSRYISSSQSAAQREKVNA